MRLSDDHGHTVGRIFEEEKDVSHHCRDFRPSLKILCPELVVCTHPVIPSTCRQQHRTPCHPRAPLHPKIACRAVCKQAGLFHTFNHFRPQAKLFLTFLECVFGQKGILVRNIRRRDLQHVKTEPRKIPYPWGNFRSKAFDMTATRGRAGSDLIDGLVRSVHFAIELILCPVPQLCPLCALPSDEPRPGFARRTR